jgi:predicted small lipoprotein YifL
MIRALALTLALTLALAACGADGPPVAPTRDLPPETGLRFSGEARFGVSAVWR